MSVFDDVPTVSVAPSWRCPHCRTLQPETTRCRACERTAVSCASCVRFRPSVAGDLGYCVDDAARSPLHGDEVRQCWTDGAGDAGLPTDGLFDELVMGTLPAPAEPQLSPAESTPPSVSAPVPPEARSPAATFGDGLVEAPEVAPGARLESALRRRYRPAADG